MAIDVLPWRKKTKVEIPPMARRKRSLIGEMSTAWSSAVVNNLRSFRKTFWPMPTSYVGTKVTYALTRKLYRNDDRKSNLGGFGKRIVNSTVDFMGLPIVASGDEIVDEFLNKCVDNYWRGELTQAFRDSCRDGETIVRVRRHDPDNPLISPEEWEACYLEVVTPETCAIYYKTGQNDTTEIDKAYIRHEVDEIQEDAKPSGRALRQPIIKSHVIIEEITPEAFRYFDETAGDWRADLEQPNSWGFVPLIEFSNEYDPAGLGGISDLEGPLPFIMAFHDVMGQALISHKAHSIPKAVFNVGEMMQFIANNWPDSFERDENGQVILTSFDGRISWTGTEVLFLEPDESAGYMEVQSALGDSQTLLDFLLTCISIASETPKSVLMNQTAQDADEMVPLAHKIARKRSHFHAPLTMICKMVLAINHMVPVKVPLAWEDITPDIALKRSQTLQQEVMSMEVLATRQVVSDRTVRQHLRPYVRSMKSNAQEATDAKKNVQMPMTSPNSTSGPTSTQSVKGTDSGKNA